VLAGLGLAAKSELVSETTDLMVICGILAFATTPLSNAI